MAFSVWLLLGGSTVFWGLKLLARPVPLPGDAAPASESRTALTDLSRLLGSTPVAAATEPELPTETRLRLLGVAAPNSSQAAQAGEGVAVIEVDGVARTVRVGASVDGDLRLLQVNARSVSLGREGQTARQVLQMSPQPVPATGNLAPAAPSPVVLGGNPVPNPTPGALPAPVPAMAPTVYGATVDTVPAPQPPPTVSLPPPRNDGLPLRR